MKTVLNDISYGSHIRQKADIYRQTATDNDRSRNEKIWIYKR